jgi:acetoacetate decarboxylase
MPVTDDMAMAGGRELGGYPKKIAQIELEKSLLISISETAMIISSFSPSDFSI